MSGPDATDADITASDGPDEASITNREVYERGVAAGRASVTPTPDATDASFDPRVGHGVSGLFRHEPGAPCVVCDATDAGSRDTLQEFGTAVGLALSERKVAEDLDADNLTFPQMVEATCGLLDRLDDAMDAFLAARGADHKTDRQMQRDLRDALAAPSTSTTEGLDVERLAEAMHGWKQCDFGYCEGRDDHIDDARGVAAEYQRLSEPE